MKPNLINIHSISKELKHFVYIQNSKYFNYVLLGIFIICFTAFIVIFYYDSKNINKKYTLNKLKYIRDTLDKLNTINKKK